MSSIEEIAKMIELDWKEMEDLIDTLRREKADLGEEISAWKDKLDQEYNLRLREVS